MGVDLPELQEVGWGIPLEGTLFFLFMTVGWTRSGQNLVGQSRGKARGWVRVGGGGGGKDGEWKKR